MGFDECNARSKVGFEVLKKKKREDFSLSRYFVTYKNGVNERFCIFINTFWKLHFSFQDLLKSQVICCTSERRFSTDKLVENAPKGPNVGSVLHQKGKFQGQQLIKKKGKGKPL